MPEPATSECAAEHLDTASRVPGYLSRQPILDRRGVVFGYELHFQEAPRAKQQDPLGEARHGLLDALALFGVEHFTDGARAFLDCGVESLVEDAWDGLSPANMVLQIPLSGPALLAGATRLPRPARQRFSARSQPV
jgi:hypothetical protein